MGRLSVDGLLASGPRCYDALPEDPLVCDWVESYRSSSTRKVYLCWFNVLCVRSKLSPSQLLELNPDEARGVVMNVVKEYLRQDKLTAARQIQTAAKSFFEYHDRAIKFKRLDQIKRARKKGAYEVIPSKDQIYRMADAFKKHGLLRLGSRAIIVCLYRVGQEKELQDNDYIFKPVPGRTRNEKLNRFRVLGLVKSLAKRIGMDSRADDYLQSLLQGSSA